MARQDEMTLPSCSSLITGNTSMVMRSFQRYDQSAIATGSSDSQIE